MSDRDKTKLLTKIGFLYLEKMGCREISTEVNVHLYTRESVLDPNFHYIIDLLGIATEYLPPSKKWDELYKVNTQTILRGVEIKVSRSDFKNGFIHHGCNFNYLLTPKGLVNPDEVHSDIGIIEVDIENFKIITYQRPFYGYELKGVELIRNPKRKIVDPSLIENLRAQIGETLTNQTKRWIKEDFLSTHILEGKSDV